MRFPAIPKTGRLSLPRWMADFSSRVKRPRPNSFRPHTGHTKAVFGLRAKLRPVIGLALEEREGRGISIIGSAAGRGPITKALTASMASRDSIIVPTTGAMRGSAGGVAGE
jgi:hypothetical protein